MRKKKRNSCGRKENALIKTIICLLLGAAIEQVLSRFWEIYKAYKRTINKHEWSYIDNEDFVKQQYISVVMILLQVLIVTQELLILQRL